MAEDEEQFDAAMIAVKRAFDEEEFEQALPLIVKAQEVRPDSVVVRRCRVFALLSLSRWSDALQVCEKSANSEDSFAFEQAYCLYRLNRFQEALDALKAGQDPDDEDRCVRLEAQVLYRMGKYEECAKKYEDLYSADSDELGLLANAVASHVSGDRPQGALALMSGQDDLMQSSYELCFNTACALIDDGRLIDAEKRLEEAKDICIKELMESEDIGEEDAGVLEDHEELASIQVQLGCVKQRRGAIDEANDLYNRVLKQRSGNAREVDITVLAVACNNVVSLRSEGKSLFDSLKRINVASKEVLEHKLTRKQSIEIATNKCLLLAQANKVEDARRELQKLSDAHPGHPRVAVVKAAIAFTEKKAKVCEEVLLAYLKEHPGNGEVVLPLAQLYAQQNKHDKAVEVLSQMPLEKRVQPRTAEAIVALHQRQKSPDKAVACLREAIEFWKKADDDQTLASVLRIAARLAMRLNDKAFAAEAFEIYLQRVDGKDLEALCGLVQALASTDVERAESYADRMQVPSFGHLDPEELENSPVPKMGTSQKKKTEKSDGEAVSGAEGEGKDSKAKAKRTRKRKVRYPKDFNAENPGPMPDPERWLPKRERAEFKKKMRKRDKHLLRGPQGATGSDDTAFRKTGPSTAQVEVSKDAGARPSRNQGRQKKGKK